MEPQPDRTPSRQLSCARCGVVFPCSLDGDCWCATEPVRLPMPGSQSGDDCICPACLRAAAAGSAPSSN